MSRWLVFVSLVSGMLIGKWIGWPAPMTEKEILTAAGNAAIALLTHWAVNRDWKRSWRKRLHRNDAVENCRWGGCEKLRYVARYGE